MSSPGRVRINDTALARMTAGLRNALPDETGGILVGWRDDPDIVVIDALRVRDETAHQSEYLLRHRAATRILDAYLDETTNELVGYVGEWHTHPVPSPPSLTDQKSIAAAARKTDAAIAIIVLAYDPARDDTEIHSGIARRTNDTIILAPARREITQTEEPDE